ncbi:hypothetical protein Tco_0332664 [Tanacetum coccineum]
MAKEEILTEPQQEKEASSTGTSEDNPKILALERGNLFNTGKLDPDDSPMPELKNFHKSETGIFDEASYNEEGVITNFNSLPIEIEVSPTPTLKIHNIHPKVKYLVILSQLCKLEAKCSKIRALTYQQYSKAAKEHNHQISTHWFVSFFLSQEEPKKISEALQDDSWVKAMQEELLQFKLARMELSDEEVYVSLTSGFVDPDHPKKVSKCGQSFIMDLLQGPRAWDKKDIMLVQIYVDDIIFGSTKKSWCDEFEALMKSRFQMSYMGELTYCYCLDLSFHWQTTTIPPLSQPAPPTPIAETTTASPSPSPLPAHEPMEHTFEQPSTDQQPPTPRQAATTSQLMTRIGDLEKQLKETKHTFGNAILTLVDSVGKYIVKDLILNSDNSYLRDILGDILGKDMHYPFTCFVKPIRVSLVYKRNPTA